jgi:ATP phosphoribosyltransferase-like protein
LALCVPDDSRYTAPADLDGRRVATSFPRVTEAFLREHNAHVHLVPISGSVEVMVALGVADAIVDLVETGSTLAANRLRILEEIGQYETILIQNRDRREAETADRVVRRLEGVVIARAYSLLEYNVPLAKLPEAEKITPGFKSPTVSRLEDPDWVAVRVMVPRSSEPTRQTERLCEESLSCHSFPTDSDGRRRGCAAESRPTATSSIGAWPRIGNDLQVWRESGEPATRFPCDFAQWQQFCTRNIRIAAIHPHWISLE